MDPSKLKVTELKEELGKRGLSIKGLKAELVERLEEALKRGDSVNSSEISDTVEIAAGPVAEIAVEESPRKRRGRSASIDTPTKVSKKDTESVIAEPSEVSEPVMVAESTVSADVSMSVDIDEEVITTSEPVVEPVEPVISEPAVAPVIPVIPIIPVITPAVVNPVIPVIDTPKIVQSQTQKQTNTHRIVHVSHLTRPFTLAEFKSLLVTFGEIEDLWLDTLKSQSFVTFVSCEGAEKCKEMLNGKRFPEQTGKLLVVELISSERMDQLKKDLEGLAATAIGATLLNTYSNSPDSQSVPLDELFKKTAAEPSIYYLPKQ